MLEIGGLGFVRSIRPDVRKLRGDACLVVSDEQNNTLWFWMGSGVQYDKRRTARGKVEQISQEGQRIGDEILGRGFTLVEIDQDKNSQSQSGVNSQPVQSKLKPIEYGEDRDQEKEGQIIQKDMDQNPSGRLLQPSRILRSGTAGRG